MRLLGFPRLWLGFNRVIMADKRTHESENLASCIRSWLLRGLSI